MDPMGFWIPGESSRKEAELLHEQIRGHAVDADAEAHSSWRIMAVLVAQTSRNRFSWKLTLWQINIAMEIHHL